MICQVINTLIIQTNQLIILMIYQIIKNTKFSILALYSFKQKKKVQLYMNIDLKERDRSILVYVRLLPIDVFQ